jgi:hypothetical protein
MSRKSAIVRTDKMVICDEVMKCSRQYCREVFDCQHVAFGDRFPELDLMKSIFGALRSVQSGGKAHAPARPDHHSCSELTMWRSHMLYLFDNPVYSNSIQGVIWIAFKCEHAITRLSTCGLMRLEQE